MLRQTVCKAHENAKIVVRLIRRVHLFGFERLKTVGTQTLAAVQSCSSAVDAAPKHDSKVSMLLMVAAETLCKAQHHHSCIATPAVTAAANDEPSFGARC